MSFSSGYLFNWDVLYAIEHQNEIASSALYKIIENQEKAYSANNNELNRKIDNDQYLSSLAEDFQGSYFISRYQSELYSIEEVKLFQRYSTLLLLFLYFEGKLKAICELIRKEHSLVSVKKSKLGHIETYWDYLTNIYKIDTSIRSHLNPITEQIFVRNKIAHQNGIFSEGQRSNFITTTGISLEKHDIEYKIMITDTIYLTDIIQKMDLFLKHLLLEVDKRFAQINELL